MSEAADGGARPEQHMVALMAANKVRQARAQLKRAIREGQRSAADVVLHPPSEALGMTVSELLRSQRRWGDNRARRVLGPLRISEQRELEQLTERQRAAVATELENAARRRAPASSRQPAASVPA